MRWVQMAVGGILMYSMVIMTWAALVNWGVLPVAPVLRNGTLMAVNVFLLSGSFVIIFISGCAAEKSNECE